MSPKYATQLGRRNPKSEIRSSKEMRRSKSEEYTVCGLVRVSEFEKVGLSQQALARGKNVRIQSASTLRQDKSADPSPKDSQTPSQKWNRPQDHGGGGALAVVALAFSQQAQGCCPGLARSIHL